MNLLNAAWTATTAVPIRDGGYTLPGQAVVAIIEADMHELNRLYTLILRLVDDNGVAARLSGSEGEQEARFEFQVIVPPVPGAPTSAPGRTTAMVDLPPGSLRIDNPRRWYSWNLSIDDLEARVGFWVEAPQALPIIGATG